MSKIYVPGPKANEYCTNAVNHYMGCDHKCKYCFVGLQTHTKAEDLAVAIPTKNTLINIMKYAHLYRGKKVFLTFLSDPYNAVDVQLKLTRQIIEILRGKQVIPVILTKAGGRSTRDFDLLDSSCWYGATLTFTSDKDSKTWEPGAALPGERMDALKEAKRRGISTWASLEPVIDPAQSLELLEMTYEYVDHFKIGKWNYDKHVCKTDWTKFLVDVRKALNAWGFKEILKPGFRKKSYYIKTSLKEAASKIR